MVGYFAGVVQAPITAFAIVAEMTADHNMDHNMMVALMASSLIASGASRLICPEGVYRILSRNYIRLYTPENTTPRRGPPLRSPRRGIRPDIFS